MTDFRKVLLAGTAVVAVGAFAVTGAPMAQAADLTMTAADTWADGDAGALDPAVTGDNVDVDTNTMTVTNDGAANDGGGVNTFVIGDVTDTNTGDADTGGISVLTGAAAADMTATIGSVAVEGNVAVSTIEANNAALAVTVTNDLTVGGTLDVTNLDTDDSDTVALSVGGDATVTGLTTVTASAGGDATLTVSGDATFTGGVSLDDDVNSAELVFDGATAQAVSGDIDGAGAGEGDVNITNSHASGVTFSGMVGDSGGNGINDVLIDDTATDVLATFQDDVTVGGDVIVGAAGGNTATAVFSTSGTLAVSGMVIGDAGSTSNVTASGGGTVTTDAAWGAGGNVDTVTIGANTTLAAGANVTATTIQLSSGSVLQDTAGSTFTANIEGGSGTFNVDGDATVDGNIGATTALTSITIAEAGSLTIDDTADGAIAVRATTITLEDALSNGTDASLVLDPDAATTTITGNIVTQIDGEGDITINDGTGAGTVAFVGNIGQSGTEVGLLAVTGAGSNETVTTTGNLYVSTITLDDADELQFLGDGVSQVVSGTIDGVAAAGEGEIIVGDGTTETTVTFNGAIGTTTGEINTFDVMDGSLAILNADATTTADFTIDGTLRVGQGVTATSAAFAAGAADGTIQLVVGNTAAGADESATLASGAALDLDLLDGTTANSATMTLRKGTGVITNGDEFVIGDGTGAVLNMVDDTAEAISDNFALFNFSLYTGDSTGVTAGDDSDIVAVASAVSASSVTATTNNANAANALLDVTAADYANDSDLAAVYDSVVGASASQIDERVEAVQPTVDGGAFVGGLTVTGQSADITETRLASLRGGDMTGMTAGNVSQGLKVWAQAYGQTGEQDRRDNIDGYDVDSWGLVAGIDTENIAEDLVLGLAFTYGDTEVDSDNANNTKTDIDTYGITLYGDYDLDDRTYLSGQVSYANHDLDTLRTNVGGVSGLNARGDFDSDQWGLRAELGRDYMVDSGLTLTPNVSANYTYVDIDSYTETGAGGANLNVDTDELHIFELGAGLDASWLHQNADGSYLKPVLSAGVRYDVIGDEVESTSTFTGGGTAFKTEGFDPAQATFNLGAGLTYFSTDNWELSAAYDFEIKEDYDAHSGYLRAAYKF